MKNRKIYRDDIVVKTLNGKKYLCTTDLGNSITFDGGVKPICEIGIWKCTDEDTKQYGRQISDILFEFKEERNGETFHSGIDISGYTDAEIEDVISSYGYSLADGVNSVFEMYGVEANWIIAECMFEMEN